jgi:hypothetical protein
MILEAARELSKENETFRRNEIIQKVIEKYPNVVEKSLHAYIGSMAKPGYRHPYLERVDYGLYRLRDQSEITHTEIGIEEEEEEELEELYETRLSLEKDLERFIIHEISSVEEGLKLMEPNYNQVPVKSGRIDVLAVDKDGNNTVIELKAGEAKDRSLAQILSYMVDIKETHNDENTRGIIIADEFSPRIISAVKMIPQIKLKKYEVEFKFIDQE